MEQPTYQQNQPPSMVESILVTVLCCLPFGIVGIIYASQVSTKWAAGDYNGAMVASQEAGKWTKIGFWIGLAVCILYVIAVFGFGLSGFWYARHRSY